ncbi:uncharacterized protein EI90DRAFT_3125511 [Cantharellus anzutake]|uniref:uncharacterized protein n=1 Tax=Cantharellus anzutake TaxID=1750568 RepID=UPI001905B365|nr:uncharacterized protein EI90DRAFT_3125511 [Cantharellus anzutake]KAF8329173.1 hypothetical protein EI90DRAFT_3125511 [Cantharellus anzutake]
MARELLVELAKCKISVVTDLVHALDGDRSASPYDWAATVHQELGQNDGNAKGLTALASYYLSHLVIAFRNPGGKRTPQESIHPTPNPKHIEEITSLLESATICQSQSALRDLIFLRDGSHCPVSNYPFFGKDRVIRPRCAHIIPFSAHSKTHTHHAIEVFTGQMVKAEFIQRFINHPSNAINIGLSAHESMEKTLAWGIEARLVDHRWKYRFREVRPANVSATIPLKDGDEIEFGKGTGGDLIGLPDPQICHLHLAVARVFAASGAAEVFDKYLEDDEDYMTQVPVYFGGPFVDDDELMRRIEALVT